MKKRIFFIFGIMILFGVMINFISAVGEVSYCCEKTTEGAWCQNAPEENCNTDFNTAPTSCESTSYCRMGCCYDSEEGTCMENTPQRVCDSFSGAWKNSATCDIPQCSLGCCVLGDQAAFVTQARCNRLSSIYSLEANFQSNIKSEIQCIASVTSDVKGACVFESNYEKTCRMLTKKECDLKKGTNENSSETSFYAGYLCTADDLNTNCRPTKDTACVDGKDEVYFLDTCGNIANIYDSSKINNKDYWTVMKNKDESCNSGKSNADSKSCGNCDYYSGSTCKKYQRGEENSRPINGDNICRDLGCEYKGQEYVHGETWCADAPGTSAITPQNKIGAAKENVPGTRYFRLLCYNGEVTVEPCADYRNEICIQDSISGIKTAACRVNKWQDCYSQTKKKDCENNDRRDCKWEEDIKLNTAGNTTNKSKTGACVPKFAPGFNFWTGGDAESFCSMASATCTVTFEKSLLGGKKTCKENCECLEGWEDEMNKACTAIGDCGSKINYLGIKGFYDKKAFYSGIGNSTKK